MCACVEVIVFVDNGAKSKEIRHWVEIFAFRNSPLLFFNLCGLFGCEIDLSTNSSRALRWTWRNKLRRLVTFNTDMVYVKPTKVEWHELIS